VNRREALHEVAVAVRQRGDQVGAQFVDINSTKPVSRLSAPSLRRTAAPE